MEVKSVIEMTLVYEINDTDYYIWLELNYLSTIFTFLLNYKQNEQLPRSRSTGRFQQEKTGNSWNMQAVFRPEIFPMISGRFLQDPVARIFDLGIKKMSKECILIWIKNEHKKRHRKIDSQKKVVMTFCQS
jgi:hypothetical protein